MPIKAIVERDPVDYLKLAAEVSMALGAAALDVQRFLSTMPPKKKKMLGGSLPGGFYTLKQKRYIHAAADRGEITIPYMRTTGSAHSWTIGPVQQVGDSMRVEVYSDPSLAPYARFVQDPFTRPRMHEDWPSPDLAKEELEDKIVARLMEVGKRYGFTS